MKLNDRERKLVIRALGMLAAMHDTPENMSQVVPECANLAKKLAKGMHPACRKVSREAWPLLGIPA